MKNIINDDPIRVVFLLDALDLVDVFDTDKVVNVNTYGESRDVYKNCEGMKRKPIKNAKLASIWYKCSYKEAIEIESKYLISNKNYLYISQMGNQTIFYFINPFAISSK